jgi:putative transcriptional regulator
MNERRQIRNLVAQPGLILLFAIALLLSIRAPAAEPVAGNAILLVAKPGLPDPNFRETVVLVTRLEAGGAPIGLILNRPLDLRLSTALPDIGAVPAQYDAIYAGGPLRQEGVLFLVRAEDRPARSITVLNNVYLSANRDFMQSVFSGSRKVAAFRAYAGYAGWGYGQLEAELMEGGWDVVEADADVIFTADTTTLWRDLNRRVGGVKTSAPATSKYPRVLKHPL